MPAHLCSSCVYPMLSRCLLATWTPFGRLWRGPAMSPGITRVMELPKKLILRLVTLHVVLE